MLRVRYVGTDLYPEGTVECVPGDAFTVLDDNTVEILVRREDKLESIGVIAFDRWCAVHLVEPTEASA